MRDQREANHGVLVDSDAIKTWSAERGVIPVYYENEERYELVYENELTQDQERHGWDEFSERFADRDEVLVHDETDGDASSARFVDRMEALEQSETTQEADADGANAAARDGSPEDETGAAHDGERAGETDERGRIDPNEDVAGTADPHADGTATTDLDGSESATETPDDAVENGDVDASDEGNRVFDRDGNEIGIVEAIDEDDGTLYVDPNPGVLDEVKAELGWGSEDEDNYVITADQIASREGHQIVIHGA